MAIADSTSSTRRARKGAALPQDHTSTSSAEAVRASALRGVAALRTLVQAAEVECGPTVADYLNKRRDDAKALVSSLGPMSREVEGAILAMAEYIHFGITTGEPSLGEEEWLPISAMTQGDVDQQIREMEDDLAEDSAKQAQRIDNSDSVAALRFLSAAMGQMEGVTLTSEEAYGVAMDLVETPDGGIVMGAARLGLAMDATTQLQELCASARRAVEDNPQLSDAMARMADLLDAVGSAMGDDSVTNEDLREVIQGEFQEAA